MVTRLSFLLPFLPSSFPPFLLFPAPGSSGSGAAPTERTGIRTGTAPGSVPGSAPGSVPGSAPGSALGPHRERTGIHTGTAPRRTGTAPASSPGSAPGSAPGPAQGRPPRPRRRCPPLSLLSLLPSVPIFLPGRAASRPAGEAEPRSPFAAGSEGAWRRSGTLGGPCGADPSGNAAGEPLPSRLSGERVGTVSPGIGMGWERCPRERDGVAAVSPWSGMGWPPCPPARGGGGGAQRCAGPRRSRSRLGVS